MSATVTAIMNDHPEWAYLFVPDGKPPARTEPAADDSTPRAKRAPRRKTAPPAPPASEEAA